MFAKALAVLLAVPFVVQRTSSPRFLRDPTLTLSLQSSLLSLALAATSFNRAIFATASLLPRASRRNYQLAVVNIGVIDSACDNLQPGSSLCLGWAGEDCTDTYVVQPSDTCDEVASIHGTNTTILYANNPQLNADCTNLYIGEVVCVSNSVIAPPPPASGTLPGSVIPSTATAAPSALPYCN
ncbi:hypothetical protein J3R82DRAFT_1901 [Butyriboletus roseoflavus]|nr:hypothetical protein J3R82DRAFT_1901 [Butyriboletus roseoflavus]